MKATAKCRCGRKRGHESFCPFKWEHTMPRPSPPRKRRARSETTPESPLPAALPLGTLNEFKALHDTEAVAAYVESHDMGALWNQLDRTVS